MLFRNVSVEADDMKLDNRVLRLNLISSPVTTPVQSFMIYFFGKQLSDSYARLLLGREEASHGVLSKHSQSHG